MKAPKQRRTSAGKARPGQGGGKRSENKEKTKQAILRAALELFAQGGFYRTTTRAISRRAGIAEGTLFNYFPTKEDLAHYFFERELEAVIHWYEHDARIQRAALPEQLFAVIHRFLDRLAPYEEFIGAVYLRALAPASKLSPWSLQTRERSLRYLRFIRGILAKAEAAGEIPCVGDLGAHAFGLFHLAMLTHWLQDRSPGKGKTLALLDRCLNVGGHFFKERRVGLVNGNATGGALARGYRIGKLGFSLMGSYLGYQAQNLLLGKAAQPQRRARFRQQASQRVRAELGALKGPAMKFGQMLSMQTDILPEEALQELAGLQMQAPSMHPTLARAQFKSALGKYPEDVFREFDAEPFAAASLGQVHRAITFNKEKVAVKIQYPAIRAAIENDLTLLRSATLPTQLTGHVPSALLDEIARGLLEETDYLHEAANLDYFREGLRHLPFVTVPRVHRELTTDRVLTMSFVEGESLSDWLKGKPSRTQRDLLGARLCEAYETQLQRLKVLHADQHPGNYLFLPDGRFGLVDFGCVKRVMFDVVEMRRCYEERSWQQNEAAARRFLAMVYGPAVPYARARKILPLLERWLDSFRPRGSTTDQVINFRDRTRLNPAYKEIRRQYQRQLLQDKLINPEYVYIMRADMGFTHLLGELGATVNVSEIIRRVSAETNRG